VEVAVDWRDRAACREADPELFFPLTDQGPSRVQTLAALEHCRRCEVREACLNWALDTGIQEGVWGGSTEEQRHIILRGRQVYQDLDRMSERFRVSA
jgi:WhiB family redox-sensing transcriptional regulator